METEVTQMSSSSATGSNMNQPAPKTLAQRWLENPIIPIRLELFSIAAGIALIVTVELNHGLHWVLRSLFAISGHGFVIIGEIIAALYFVHMTLERQNVAHSASLLTSLTHFYSASVRDEISKLTTQIRSEALHLTNEIKVDMFKALLQGQNIMPYQMIDLIKNSDYDPNLLRTGLEIEFDCLEESNGCLLFSHTMRYDLKNISERTMAVSKFDMHLAFNDTKQVEYKFKSAEYYYSSVIAGGNKKPYERTVLNDENYPFDDERECRELATSIELYGSESVRVFQQLQTCYMTEGNTVISDNFYATQHTIGVKISVKRLPEHYEFWVYPTSTRGASSVHFVEDALVCDEIAYLLPGQGYFIELVKKQIPQTVA